MKGWIFKVRPALVFDKAGETDIIVLEFEGISGE